MSDRNARASPTGRSGRGLEGEIVKAKRDWRHSLVRLMWVCAATVVALSFASYLVAEFAPSAASADLLSEVHENVNVGTEMNLPTWLASILWAIFALAALYHWHETSANRGSWLLLSLVGWAASIDEYLMLHDRLSRPGARIEAATGIDLAGATWVLVGVAVAAVVGSLLLRFVLRLPVATKKDLIAGAFLFLLGAIGFEVFSNVLFDSTGDYGWLVALTVHLEEGLEFAGVVLAARGLIRMLPPPDEGATTSDALVSDQEVR